MPNYSTPYANLNEFYNPYEDFNSFSDDENPVSSFSVKVSVTFGEKYIKPLFVIVEMYDHKSYGRGKREYMKQFTKEERKTISKYYAKLYNWYLRRGIPIHGVTMQPSTYDLLCRAANFFVGL